MSPICQCAPTEGYFLQATCGGAGVPCVFHPSDDLPESSQVSESRPGAPGTSGDPNGGQIPYIPYNPNAIPIPGGLGTAPNKPTPTPQQKEQQLKDELGHGCTVVSGLLVLGDAAIVFSGQGYLAPASLSLSFHAWAACGLATW